MAIDRKDFSSLIKGTTFIVAAIEDESGEETEVKVLHLVEPFTAKSSKPMTDGKFMTMKTKEIYIGSEKNVDLFLAGATKNDDGTLTYKGALHTDISRPDGRMVRGKFSITKPARVWLTPTKFSKLGGNMQQDRQSNLETLMSGIFGGGKVFDATVESQSITTTVENTVEPEIVANVTAEVGE